MSTIQPIRTRLIMLGFFLFFLLVFSGTTRAAQTFQNPVLAGADPWITFDNGTYYYSASYMDACTTGTICIKSSTTLTGLTNAPWVGVWTPPASPAINCCNVWAPEIHKVNGSWYIYYSAFPDTPGAIAHLFVLKATTSNPLGPYAEGATGAPHGQLVDSTGRGGIDADVFTAANGLLYITWSCGTASVSVGASTCIAPMSDALHISGSAVTISQPTQAWERRSCSDPAGDCNTQEGQVGFTRGGNTYITYSASVFFDFDKYNTGLLVNTNGYVLDPNSWTKVGPIFDRHGTATNTASPVFIQSRDNRETWTFYQGVDRSCTPDAGTCRNVRMQKVYWGSDGIPVLGYPYNSGVAINVPSGEQGFTGTGSILTDWGNAYGDAAEGNTIDGKVVGTWISPDRFTSRNQSLGADWNQNFSGRNPNFENYTLNAGMQWVQTGTTSAFPKYGVWAAYSDVRNNVSFWIDINYGVVTSNAVINGVDQGWLDCSLPAGFVPGNVNTLRVTKSWNDAQLLSTFRVSLNGTALSGACTGRTFNILSGQIGLVTEDTKANYSNVTVTNTM